MNKASENASLSGSVHIVNDNFKNKKIYQNPMSIAMYT